MGIFKNWGKGFKRFGKSIKSGFVGKKGVFGRKGPFGKIGNPFAGKGLFTDKGALFRKGGIGDRIVRPFEKVGEGVGKVAVAAGDTATGIGKAAVDTASGIGTAATDSLSNFSKLLDPTNLMIFGGMALVALVLLPRVLPRN